MKSLIKEIVDCAFSSGEGHIASSLSVLDILCVLHQGWKGNFILSKGHAALGFYVVLNHFGRLSCELSDFCKFYGRIGGHPSDSVPGVFASTGSLGHGLPIGVGAALGEKIKGSRKKTVVLIGDGEANEGTIWESAMLASHHKLKDLTCIMDYNHSGDRALLIDSPMRKFESFGWKCIEIDGHNHTEIGAALSEEQSYPLFVQANTVKGHGIAMMENNPEWHHKAPNEKEYLEILASLL